MILAPALARPLSARFQSPSSTEIAILRPGYSGAVPSLHPILTELRSRQGVRLGSMGVRVRYRINVGRAAGRMAVDLSPAGLESGRQPHGESGRGIGVN